MSRIPPDNQFAGLVFPDPDELINLAFRKTRVRITEDDPLLLVVYLNEACLAHAMQWMEARLQAAHDLQLAGVKKAYSQFAEAAAALSNRDLGSAASNQGNRVQFPNTPEEQARFAGLITDVANRVAAKVLQDLGQKQASQQEVEAQKEKEEKLIERITKATAKDIERLRETMMYSAAGIGLSVVAAAALLLLFK